MNNAYLPGDPAAPVIPGTPIAPVEPVRPYPTIAKT